MKHSIIGHLEVLQMENAQDTGAGNANLALGGLQINISGVEQHKLNIIIACVCYASIGKFQIFFYPVQ